MKEEGVIAIKMEIEYFLMLVLIIYPILCSFLFPSDFC